MKFVFRNIGPKKFSKIVEITELPEYKNVMEFAERELLPYFPEKAKIELVPTDGLDLNLSNAYTIVYYDGFITRGMGIVLVYV